MFCSKCGSRLGGSGNFCHLCGEKVSYPAAPAPVAPEVYIPVVPETPIPEVPVTPFIPPVTAAVIPPANEEAGAEDEQSASYSVYPNAPDAGPYTPPEQRFISPPEASHEELPDESEHMFAEAEEEPEKQYFGKPALVFCLIVIGFLSVACGVFAMLYFNAI
jgi:hypothetical protein